MSMMLQSVLWLGESFFFYRHKESQVIPSVCTTHIMRSMVRRCSDNITNCLPLAGRRGVHLPFKVKWYFAGLWPPRGKI